MRIIKCERCGVEVEANGSNRKFCNDCIKDKSKERKKEYRKSHKYKEYKKEYQKTDKSKEYHKEYRKSDKYKEHKKEYEKTDTQTKHRIKKYIQNQYQITDIPKEIIETKLIIIKTKRLCKQLQN
jgi:hypothetical protein